VLKAPQAHFMTVFSRSNLNQAFNELFFHTQILLQLLSTTFSSSDGSVAQGLGNCLLLFGCLRRFFTTGKQFSFEPHVGTQRKKDSPGTTCVLERLQINFSTFLKCRLNFNCPGEWGQG